MAKAGELQFVITVDNKGAVKAIKETGDAQESLGKTTKDLNQQIGATITRYSKYAIVAGTVLAAALAKITKNTIDFNKEISLTASLMPQMDEEVEALRKNVQDLSIEFGKSTIDMAQGAYQVVSAFGAQEAASEKLRIVTKAAAAGNASVTESLNLLSAVTKGYGDITDDATSKASDLAFMTVKLGQTTFPELAASIGRVVPNAAKLLVTQEELFSGFATLTGVTGSAAEVSTQLAAIMRAFIKPTEDMRAAIAKLGIGTAEQTIETLGLVGTLRELIKNTDGTSESVGKLFGRAEALTSVFALTGGQAEVFDQKFKEIKDSVGATDEAFQEISEGINKTGFTLEQTKQSFIVFTQKIADTTLQSEGFQQALERVSAAFQDEKFIEAISSITVFLSDLISKFVEATAAFAEWLNQTGQADKIFAQQSEQFKNNANKMVEALINAGVSVNTINKAILDMPEGAKFQKISDGAIELSSSIQKLKNEQDELNKIEGEYGLNFDQVIRRQNIINEIRDSTEDLNEINSERFDLLQKIIPQITKNAEAYGITKEQIDKYRISLKESFGVQANVKEQIKESNEEIQKTQTEILELEKAQNKYNLSAKAYNFVIEQMNPKLKEINNLQKKLGISAEEAERVYGILNKTTKQTNENYENLISSIGIINKESLKNMNREVEDLTLIFNEYGSQIESSAKIQENLWKKLTELIENYKQAGKEIPVELQIAFEKVDELINRNIVTTNEFLKENVEITKWVSQSQKTATETTIDFSSKLTSLSSNLSEIAKLGKQNIDVLSDIGIISEKTAGRLNGIVGGIGGIANGMEALNQAKGAKGLTALLGNLGGAFSIASSAITIFSGVLGAVIDLFTGDGIQEAIDRENSWMNLSEELNEKLHELAEQVGDTHAATSLMLSDIMKEANITVDNFSQWASRMEEILIDMDNGTISVAQATESLGKSFNKLIDESRKLGIEGSAEMVRTIRNLRKRGLEVAEVTEYINEQLDVAISGFSKYISGANEIASQILQIEEKLGDPELSSREYKQLTEELNELKKEFGDTIDQEKFSRSLLYATGLINSLQQEGMSLVDIISKIGPELDSIIDIASAGDFEVTGLSEILGLREFVTDNQEVINGLQGTLQMLQGLGNTGYLTAELFQGFQQDALDYFSKLSQNGEMSKEAFMVLAPMLAQLQWYAEQNNIELDENIKKLIEDAEARGINIENMQTQEQLQQEMNQSLKDLVFIMEQFTGITREGTEALNDMNNNAIDGFRKSFESADRFNNKLKDINRRAEEFGQTGGGNNGGGTNGNGGSQPITLPDIPKPIFGFKNGGSFTVPQGFPDDSFVIGLTSGERVDVTPSVSGSNMSGGGFSNRGISIYSDININVTEASNPKETVRQVIEGLRKNEQSIAFEVKRVANV